MSSPRVVALSSLSLCLALSACVAPTEGAPVASQEAAAGAREAGAPQPDDAGDAGTSSPEAGDAPAPANTFTDPRDGKTYPTLTLGGLTWLARNLDHDAPGSSCYEGDPARCAEHGRLYTWTAAQTACPPSTRLSSDADWKALERALGMTDADLDAEGYTTVRGTREGETLKDPRGFGVTPAGFRAGASYSALGDRSYFWTSTTRGGEVFRRRVAASTPTVFRFTNPPSTFAISVRCVVE